MTEEEAGCDSRIDTGRSSDKSVMATLVGGRAELLQVSK